MVVRLRPTLPHRHQCSTIGAEGLSFRVRNGAGRFPFAMTAETLWRCIGCLFPDRISGTGQWTRRLLLLPPTPQAGWGCVSSYRLISTSQLHALLHFHIWPINPVVYWEPLRACAPWKPHLETCFPLRCFQRLSLPNVANQRCPWQDN